MKLEELHSVWAQDSEIDFSQPHEALRQIPQLHHKWWKIYTGQRANYLAAEKRYKDLRHERMEYFTGRLDDAIRQARGWPPQPLRLVRQEVDSYLDADGLLQPLKESLEISNLKLKFLEDVIKHINGRGYLVKTYVDYLRFSQGQ